MVKCTSCGGSGGGPFGPPGSAWDREEWRCPRCSGTGKVEATRADAEGPGVAKPEPPGAAQPEAQPAAGVSAKKTGSA